MQPGPTTRLDDNFQSTTCASDIARVRRHDDTVFVSNKRVTFGRHAFGTVETWAYHNSRKAFCAKEREREEKKTARMFLIFTSEIMFWAPGPHVLVSSHASHIRFKFAPDIVFMVPLTVLYFLVERSST